MSSEHVPITVSFVFSAEETPATTSKYSYDLANWDLFGNLLGTAEINVGDADLDEVNRRIVSSILEAAREAIPVTGGGLLRSNSNPWWNKECEEAVRLKRVMYRHYSKDQNAETHERMKAANRLQQDHSTGQEGSLDSLRGFYFGWEGGLRICVEEDQKNEATVRCS